MPSSSAPLWRSSPASAVPSPAPVVSVLIPSFNHARYLDACLDAVVAEGYPAIELVLLDDGSSDDSFAIASAWVERHGASLAGGWKIGRQSNRGVTTTLNRLVAEARGEFIAFVASDDVLIPGGIAARVEFLERRRDLLAVFGDAEMMRMDGSVGGRSAFDINGTDRRALRHRATLGVELICHWFMPGPVMLMRRETMARVGPFDERYAYEDRDYYLRLIAAGAVGFLDRPVARYRMPPAKKQARYESLAHDRSRIELSHVARLRGLERLALFCVAHRRRRPRSIWVRPLKRLQTFLRRFNQRKAIRLDG